MKEYSTFPKALEEEPNHQIQFSVLFWTLVGGVLPPCRDTVGVFYSLIQLANQWHCFTNKEYLVQNLKYLHLLTLMYYLFQLYHTAL